MKQEKRNKKRVIRDVGNGADARDRSNSTLRPRVAETAYFLYERRGRADGHDLEDWLEAEAIVRSETE
ncbi:hypothetical protein YTPLAS18_05140 [Nitrospira sp.]|nr:hypothetical protein YTPLAS18_05140 [Nitrospira sp.]